MGQRALGYAASGVPVFPCVPGGKVPLTPSGFYDATTDPAVITTWWTRHAQANVAAPTGAPAFDVLDVDVRADGSGWDAFHEARRAGLIDGWVRAVQTPSGGLHLHYPGTDQRSGSIRGRYLDFRGQGGYVLLPPSRGQTKTYSDWNGLHNITDKATRYTICVRDNGNGTVTRTQARPGGVVAVSTGPGRFPAGPRVFILEDDSYNPMKAYEDEGIPRNVPDPFTWHWDNIRISST
jgi:hypothetical protein